MLDLVQSDWIRKNDINHGKSHHDTIRTLHIIIITVNSKTLKIHSAYLQIASYSLSICGL